MIGSKVLFASSYLCLMQIFLYAVINWYCAPVPQVSGSLFGSHEFEFYTYETDMKQLLDGVREKINEVAESWSREEKDLCLEETEKSFAYSGSILRNIVLPAPVKV